VAHSQIIMRPKHIRRNRTRKVVSKLLLVRPILHIHHPLCVCIAEITLVRFTNVDLVLV